MCSRTCGKRNSQQCATRKTHEQPEIELRFRVLFFGGLVAILAMLYDGQSCAILCHGKCSTANSKVLGPVAQKPLNLTMG